jgi:hypothetical protein
MGYLKVGKIGLERLGEQSGDVPQMLDPPGNGTRMMGVLLTLSKLS